MKKVMKKITKKPVKTVSSENKKVTTIRSTKQSAKKKVITPKKTSPVKNVKSAKITKEVKKLNKSAAKKNLTKTASIASIDDNKSKGEESLCTHCNLCKKPFEIKVSEKSWRMLCPSCFLKVKGKIAKCSICYIEFLALPGKEEKVCYDCNIGIHEGIKKNCVSCKKSFFTKKKCTLQKNKCYECYLKETGTKTKCTTCKADIYVKPEDMSWKKKCYTCYIHNN